MEELSACFAHTAHVEPGPMLLRSLAVGAMTMAVSYAVGTFLLDNT